MPDGKRYRIETVPGTARRGWSLTVLDRPRGARVRAEFEAECGGRIVVHIAPVRVRPASAAALRISVREDVEVRFETSEVVEVDDVLRAIADLKQALAAGGVEVAEATSHPLAVAGGPRRRPDCG